MLNDVDFLTCGACQAEFPLSHIVTFMQHKKYSCNDSLASILMPAASSFMTRYRCCSCPKQFGAAISLLQHAQYQHELAIFAEEKIARKTSNVSENTSETSLSAPQTPKPAALADQTESIMPLDKCCASVVPKKRKRHIETKHNTRVRRMNQLLPTGDIYIDLDSNAIPESSTTTNAVQNHSGSNQQVLLQPGSTYTIPMSGVSVSSSPSVLSQPTRTVSLHNQPIRSEISSSSTTSSSDPGPPKVETAQQLDVIAAGPSDSKSAKKTQMNKLYKCQTCDNAFKQRIHLKKHESKHTGVKPYKCGQCDYATVERSHLKVHIRIHTGEKPYKCDHCEYATAQNSTLKIHLKRHHAGGLLLECSHCGKSFPEKHELYKHKQEHADTNQLDTQDGSRFKELNDSQLSE